MALGKDYNGQDCSLARALELVGERWTLLVLRDAFYGIRRYSDFLDHLGAPRAVLAERLQALVDAGVLDKVRYQDSPPRYEYVLTEAGEELWPAVNALAWWGRRHRSTGGTSRGFYHVICGSRIDGTTTCPTCGHAVPAAEVEARVGPSTNRNHDNRISRALRKPHRLLEPLTIE